MGAFLSFCPTPVWAHHEPAKIRYFMHRCSQERPLDCIHRASLHRHVPFRTMTGIAWRESRYDPYAKNPSSTASGLFQFLNTTWANTPYASRNVFSAKWNSLAAAYLMSQPGGMSHWACC